MPLHDFQCRLDHVTERFVPHGTDVIFCVCGEPAGKVFLHAPLVRGDLPGYESPVSGKWIEGRRARVEDLKQTGCRPYEDGEREQYTRRKVADEQAFEARLDATIDQTIQEMPVQKRERLQAEMDGGVDCVVARSTPDVAQSTN